MRILFWGTPEFATPALRALVGEGYDVAAVVTQPDRAQGRSRSTLVPSPVKSVALDEGLMVWQPESPREESFVAQVRELKPDLSIVVAYGHLLPRELVELPTRGTWNIHASLLPRWRGAAPIQAAILHGDAESGVTIMRMVQRMDAGPSLLQRAVTLNDSVTGGELTMRLSELGAQALIEALTLHALGELNEQPQDEALVTFAGKIDRGSALINWTDSAEQASRVIRAFDPRPGAWTTLRTVDTKLFGATAIHGVRGDPGSVVNIDEHGALIACGSGAVRVGYIQPAGKRRMAALDLAQGGGLSESDVFAN
jgi:methionyl-tRNA formyltransferase